MNREDLEAWLKSTILKLRDELSDEHLVPSASLFRDLGFDSFAFEQLLAAIESSLSSIDVTPWYVGASQDGEDTLGSLIEFLLGEGTHAAPGGSS